MNVHLLFILISLLSLIAEIELTDTRPSIIAGAAILALVDGQLTRNLLDLKMSSISFWHSEDYVSMLVTSICSLRLSFEDLNVDNELMIHFN